MEAVEELTISFIIELYDQLNIGSGAISVRGADIALALLDNNLPTPSFKGVLRKACNRIVHIVNNTWKPCTEISPEGIMEKCNPNKPEYRWMKLLGIPGETHKYYITPLMIKKLKVVFPEKPQENVYTYTHISIKASTLTVKEGSLYSIEYLPRGTMIEGEIILLIEPQTQSSDKRYGIGIKGLPVYLKLLLACLAETPYVGLGRQSKTFKIKIVNTSEILDKINRLGIALDDETKSLLEKLGKGVDPFKGDQL